MSEEDDPSRTIRSDSTAITLTTDDLLALQLSGNVVDHRYADHGEIGRGGSSTVRRVFDKALLRETALKVLASGGQGTAESRALSFLDEARLTGQLEHPAIIPIHDLGTDATGHHYFSMKLVQGQTLEQLIIDSGDDRLSPATLENFLKVFVRVCEAMAFAHSRAVIHRDLKPENIMVGAFGQVYVMDWGIARILQNPRHSPDESARVALPGGASRYRVERRGDIIGTPLYMSPEQANGLNDQLDERTDVFSLGAILYQILTGRPPYDHGPTMRVLVQANRGDIQPPHVVAGDRVPPEMERITMKAMALKPEDRYDSVLELQEEVERFLRGAWHMPEVRRPAGSLIIIEGEAGDEAYILVEGRCAVFRMINGQRTELGHLNAGDVFGELAVFSNQPRAASVEALTPVRLMVVSAETLNAAVGMDSWVGRFVRALADRFRTVDARLQTIQTQTNFRAIIPPR